MNASHKESEEDDTLTGSQSPLQYHVTGLPKIVAVFRGAHASLLTSKTCSCTRTSVRMIVDQ